MNHFLLRIFVCLNPCLQEFSYTRNPENVRSLLVTLRKMQPHYSQSSRENATPSSGTSPVAGRYLVSLSYSGYLLFVFVI